ncbi:MAG: class I SAM-dependent methyltransferase [Anaerolineales bacterium]
MQPKTVTKLLAINHQFYQTFAGEFAATRMRLQPGVMRVLETIPPDARILDLGCGNGELGRELLRRGHRALYVGLDFSAELLANARQGIADCGFRISDFGFLLWYAVGHTVVVDGSFS